MADQPHLLILISDQHNASIMGAAGDRVQTPWLDDLSERGTRFETCYCNHPLCVPSRSSFLTSRYTHELEVWGNGSSLSSNIPTFAHGLGAAGYHTVLVGRMHFVGGDQHHGFAERRLGDVSSGHIATNRAEYRWRGFFGIRESVENAGPGVAHDLAFDQAVAMEACRVIRDHEESGNPRPLCLVASFYSPHDPYRVYEEYYEPYAAELDEPTVPRHELHPAIGRYHELFASATPEQIGRARAAYRGKTTFLDYQLGMIMRTWRASRLADNDVTVYFSDHGDMLGEHGTWAKSVFYEGATRVPLIMAGAGIEAATCTEPVSLIDLGPTLLDLGGAEPLPRARGRSLRPLLAGETRESPAPPILAELLAGGVPSRMVRHGEWKLNLYDGLEPELFHLTEDPHEQQNLADDPAHAETLAELQALATADGWNPEQIRETAAVQAEHNRYIGNWVKRVKPEDTLTWGMPAPL